MKRIIVGVFLSALVFALLGSFSFAQIQDDVDVGGTIPEKGKPVTVEDLTLYSLTHPDQGKWYRENTITFTWNKPNEPTGYSYVFDQNSNTIPDNISEGLAQEKTYSGVADSIWYFHLKALGDSFTPPVLHWKVNIDTTPPEFEYIRFQEGSSTTNRKPTLEFSATDTASGVDYYEYKLTKDNFTKVESPHKVERLNSGLHTAQVKVYDKAGNSNLGKAKIEIIALVVPKITKLTRVVSLFQNVKIWGTGPKNSKITLFVTPESNSKEEYKWKTKTDGKGKWYYVHSDYLKPGKYEVYAKAYDEAGGESEKSNTKTFLVSIKGIAMFGVIIPLWVIIIAIAIFLILFKYCAPYILLIIPIERVRIVTIALFREGELMLLEKKREFTREKPIYEFPHGTLKPRENPESAAIRIAKEHFSGVKSKIIKKLNFSIIQAGRQRPVSIIIFKLISGEPDVNKEKGYVGYWWVDFLKDADKYFENIPDGFQKQTFIALQKYLNKENRKK